MPRSTRKPRVYRKENSTFWFIAYYDEHDKLVRCSAKTTVEREAWKELERRLKEVEERKLQGGGNLPIDKGFDLFMEQSSLKPTTRSRYETSMMIWLGFFDANAITDFSQVTKKVIGQFIEWRKRRGVERLRKVPTGELNRVKRPVMEVRKVALPITEATIRRDLAFLSSCWNFLLDHHDWEDRMPPMPIGKRQKKKLKDSRQRVRFASDEEWAAIMGATTEEYQRRILTVAVETGLREQELCNLLWTQVDLHRRQIVLLPDVVDTKNSDPRVIPLSDAAVRALTDTPRKEGVPFVFWHGDGRRYTRMSNWWRATKRRSGVQNFKFHDIRHTFASNFLNDGGDISVLQKILGHSSVQVTERYAHLLTERLHEEMRKRDGKMAEKNNSLSKLNSHSY